MRKYIIIFSIVLIALLGLAGIVGYNIGKANNSVGGTWHNSTEDFSEGISVDNNVVINSSGQYVGAINGTTGAFSGVVVTNTFTQGGGTTSTSTANSAETLPYSYFDTENYISYTLTVQDATLTLPPTSTLISFIPNLGDTRTIYIRNATTTATMDLTIAGNTGVVLKKATSSATIYGDTDGANYARLDFVRRNANYIDVLMNIFTD